MNELSATCGPKQELNPNSLRAKLIEQEASVADLRFAFEELMDRLAPILTAELPEDDSACSKESVACAVSETAQRNTAGVRRVTKELRLAIARIDL